MPSSAGLDCSAENIEHHYNQGNGLMVQGRFAEAAIRYEHVLRLRPEFAEAHNNLGVALAELGDLMAAVDQYRKALRLRPDFAEAHYDLGNALRELGVFEESESSYQQALRLKPDWPEVWTNLGLACFAQGKFEQAVQSHKQALRLKADFAEAHNNLGIALQIQGKLDKSLPHFDQAIELRPDFALAHCNRALAWLLLGDFARGWPEYEWRWNVSGFPPLPSGVSLWDGSPLTGKTILLYAEQGLGDSLQFIRYARLVQGRGGRVIVLCRPQLLRILGTSPGVDEVAVETRDLPSFDVQAALMSLPRIFQTPLASVPADVPYLFADASLEAVWRHEIGELRRFKIGIVWQGSPRHANDRQRSIPLALFSTLSRLPGVQLFSLQKGAGGEQIRQLAREMAMIDLSARLCD